MSRNTPPTLRHVTPPCVVKKPVTLIQHGRERIDNYGWLKDENWQQVMQSPTKLNPDIKDHLERENAYAAAVMAELTPLKDKLFDEMKNRQQAIDSSVPSPDGEYAYFHQFRDGDQYGVFKQVKIDPVTKTALSPPRDILDIDKLAAQKNGFFNLGSTAHSPDHKWLVYSVDRKGSETFEVFLKPMHGKAKATGIIDSAGGLEWGRDSQTLFWVIRDDNQRPYAVYSRDIHDLNSTPQLRYKETDPGYFVSISKSDSGEFIHISAHNHTTSELWLIPSDAPNTPPQCVSKRQEGREYSYHEQGSNFYILTNADGATDFQIMQTPKTLLTSHLNDEDWQSCIAHTPGTLIIAMETYAQFMVRLVREDALPKIIIRNMKTGAEHDIKFDETAYALGLIGGHEYDTPWLRFSYSSPTTPRQLFDYNMQTGERILRKTQIIPSGHDPKDYLTERLMITGRDGTDIPVTLIMKADTPKNGTAPVLLYGYGAYGHTIAAGFRTNLLSLVDRGFIYAIAHVRGGMAKGYQWYLDGKLSKKTHSFNDFIDVGRALCAINYTRKGHIIAHGGSAGGLLVGASVNQAPDLFGGVIAAVPFVDVLNTMSDENLPLTPPEWPEWGNPITEASAYDRIESYSPYDQVKAQAYPAMFITAGLTDPRVTYWEPAKWAAQLREHQTGNAPILLKTNMEAGHQGESGRYDSLKEVALEYAFAISICQTDMSPV